MTTFGNYAIDKALVDKVQELLPRGSIILELGSGEGSTPALSENYKLISVEESLEWLNKYPNVQYIHCPLKPHKSLKNFEEYKQIWYNADILRPAIAKTDYDLILVDGPSSLGSRVGLFKYFDLFKQNVPMVFDDLQRVREWKVINSLSNKLQRPYTVYPNKDGKPFAILHKV